MSFIIPEIRKLGQNVELHVVCRLLSLLKMCRKGDNFQSVTRTCLFVKQTLWQCKHLLPLPCIDQIHRPGPLEFSCPCSVGWGTSCGAVRGWPETDKITGVISLSIVLFAATLALVCFGTVWESKMSMPFFSVQFLWSALSKTFFHLWCALMGLRLTSKVNES